MARTRQQNLSAAQWSPNGGALGAPDLTAPQNQLFGANVFGVRGTVNGGRDIRASGLWGGLSLGAAVR